MWLALTQHRDRALQRAPAQAGFITALTDEVLALTASSEIGFVDGETKQELQPETTVSDFCLWTCSDSLSGCWNLLRL